MNYTIGNYQIEIFSDLTYKVGSADNANQYDYAYFEKSDDQYASIFGIKVFKDNTPLKSAVIGAVGGETEIHKTSIIIESDRFLVCCSDTIFCLSISELSLLWRTQADDVTCFEIYKYQNDYIVHGEIYISRLDHNGEILWQQSGADIFMTIDGDDDLVITDNYILATDWDYKKYKFDFNGHSVK